RRTSVDGGRRGVGWQTGDQAQADAGLYLGESLGGGGGCEGAEQRFARAAVERGQDVGQLGGMEAIELLPCHGELDGLARRGKGERLHVAPADEALLPER